MGTAQWQPQPPAQGLCPAHRFYFLYGGSCLHDAQGAGAEPGIVLSSGHWGGGQVLILVPDSYLGCRGEAHRDHM